MREITDTGRTAITNGRAERIYEARSGSGVFAGARYELLESELTDRERGCYCPDDCMCHRGRGNYCGCKAH